MAQPTQFDVFTLDFPYSPRRKQDQGQMETIEPWREGVDGNPFNMYRSQGRPSLKSVRRSIKMEVRSVGRLNEKLGKVRQCRQLPVMDIGKTNKIKKSSSSSLVKVKTELPIMGKKRESEGRLGWVSKELLIERKLFLMRKIDNCENPTNLHKCTYK